MKENVSYEIRLGNKFELIVVSIWCDEIYHVG